MTSQLSAQDAQFLYVQSGNVLTHVMSIGIYEPSGARRGADRYRDLVRHVSSRIHASPIYRRRLHRVPLDLDFPYWVENADFNVADHITRMRLAPPGDWRQFRDLAARHFATAMNMERPLWDIVFVDGLKSIPRLGPGSYALLQRFHHAAIDGISGSYALAVLCDRDEHGTPLIAHAAEGRGPVGGIPTPVSLFRRAVTSHMTSPVRMLDAVRRLSPALAEAARTQITEPRAPASDIPAARFNATVSAQRTLAAVEFPLQAVRDIRSLVAGATVNDVILAVCSGALRTYLAGHGELPVQSLVAIVPINARVAGDEEGMAGNNVSAMSVPLATHLTDPVQRLQAIHDSTSDAKQAKAGLGARLIADLTRHIPSVAMSGMARLMTNERFAHLLGNLIITNVRGSPEPLYMCGARLTHQLSMGPVSNGMGLFIAATSYDGVVSLAITADPALLPDVDLLSDCMETSFAELKCKPRRKSRPRKR